MELMNLLDREEMQQDDWEAIFPEGVQLRHASLCTVFMQQIGAKAHSFVEPMHEGEPDSLSLPYMYTLNGTGWLCCGKADILNSDGTPLITSLNATCGFCDRDAVLMLLYIVSRAVKLFKRVTSTSLSQRSLFTCSAANILGPSQRINTCRVWPPLQLDRAEERTRRAQGGAGPICTLRPAAPRPGAERGGHSQAAVCCGTSSSSQMQGTVPPPLPAKLLAGVVPCFQCHSSWAAPRGRSSRSLLVLKEAMQSFMLLWSSCQKAVSIELVFWQ